MTPTIEAEPITIELPPIPNWEDVQLSPPRPSEEMLRLSAAFQRLLPELLQDHKGKFVVLHNEQVVGFGDDGPRLALETLQRLGRGPIFVGLVTDAPPPRPRLRVREIRRSSTE